MNGDKPETILIIDSVTSSAALPGGLPFEARGVPEAVAHVTECTVDEVRQNMTRFIKSAQSILEEGAKIAGGFDLDNVEISAQVTGEGKIGFLGMGMNVSGQTGLKLVFKRNQAG